jgi:hypothetical protein
MILAAQFKDMKPGFPRKKRISHFPEEIKDVDDSSRKATSKAEQARAAVSLKAQ